MRSVKNEGINSERFTGGILLPISPSRTLAFFVGDLMAKFYVYLMRSGTRDGDPIKIGVSASPDRRVKDLQTGNPKEIRLLCSFPFQSKHEAFKLERFLHIYFQKYVNYGEWFTLNNFGNKIKKALTQYHETGYVFVAEEKVESGVLRQAEIDSRIKDAERLVASAQKKARKMKEQRDAYRKLCHEHGIVSDGKMTSLDPNAPVLWSWHD